MFRVDRLSEEQKARLHALVPTMRLDEGPDETELRNLLTILPNGFSPEQIEAAIKVAKQDISKEQTEDQVQCFELSYALEMRLQDKPEVLAALSNGGLLFPNSDQRPSLEELHNMKLNSLRENGAEDLVERYDKLFGRGRPHLPMGQESGSGDGRDGGGSKEEQQVTLGL